MSRISLLITFFRAASLCKFEDSYDEFCEQYGESKYDWLHVNLDKVVAFSFVR